MKNKVKEDVLVNRNLKSLLILLIIFSFGTTYALSIKLRSFEFNTPIDFKVVINDGYLYSSEPLKGENFYIVQFKDRIFKEDRKMLENLGVKILEYLPENAYIVKMNKKLKTVLTRKDKINWIGLYQPFMKLAPELYDFDFNWNPGEVFIQLFKGEVVGNLVYELREFGIEVYSITGKYRKKLHCKIPIGDNYNEILREIANYPEVSWIEPYPIYTLCNDNTIWVCQSGLYENHATPVWDNGIYGEGQYVAILDTGCDADMCYFYDETQGLPGEPNPNQRKIYSYQDLYSTNNWDQVGHGTHTACTIAGDNFANPIVHDNGDGIAPAAKLVIQDAGVPGDLEPPDDMYGCLQDAYDDLARIHSNSWGWPYSNGEYHIHSQEVDQFTWDHYDFLSVYAMGNEGPGGATMRAPATAKNCISVGATRPGEQAEDNADFSSHGPTADGRRKPDVTLCGVSINSAANDGSPDTFNCSTTHMSGTSMATPGVSGCAALVREYYEDGYYPLGYPAPEYSFNPSAALVKATIINSADNMTGAYTADSGSGHQDIPSMGQGWGRVHLDNALYFDGDRRDTFIDDNTDGINTGDEVEYTLAVISSDEHFEVTLVWSDYPSTPQASQNLVNDLDLVVEHNGTTYLGNNYSNGESVPGGQADRLNNVECVQINDPEPGVYVVRVIGYNIPEGPQPFALVATGDFAFSDGIIALDREKYNCQDTITIRLSDFDLRGLGTYDVDIWSDSEPTPETVTLNETNVNSGVFEGTIQTTTSSPNPGQLYVQEGDTITVRYIDEDNGHGGYNIEKTDDAQTDCTAPTIGMVAVTDITGISAKITWITNEESNSIVYYGNVLPPQNVASDNSRVTNHEITLTDLQDDTTYYFYVSSIDEAGNVAIDDNNGQYYNFHTLRILVVFRDDFEQETGWQDVGDGQWERDTPAGLGGTFMGLPDPQGDHTYGNGKAWGTDLTVDGDYNSFSNCILQSPPIDCRNILGAHLDFWQWLNVSSNDLIFKDAVYLEISNDNGSTWNTVWSLEDGYAAEEWELKSYDISQWADEQQNVRIRFRLTSGPLFNNSGWNIDDLAIWGYDNGQQFPTPTPTPTPTSTSQIPTPTPTNTPTKTPTPTPTGTYYPTNTPIYTYTPTAIPTTSPHPTTPPNPTSTPPIYSPTPRPTPLPTSTPTQEGRGISLYLNQKVYHAGDPFIFGMTLWNYEEEIIADVYIVLDVAGSYWFWPSWSEMPNIDYERRMLRENYYHSETILEFIWPSGAGSYSGVRFWGAITEMGTYNLLADVVYVSFDFE